MSKALIFDLDGTLADTIYSILDAIHPVFRELNFPERSYDDVSRALGCNVHVLIERLVPGEYADDYDFVESIVKKYNAEYDNTYLSATLFDGIAEVVRELKRRGYLLAVLSNKTDRYVKDIVNKLFPDGEITIAQGCTALPAKPDPTVPRLMAEQLGVSPEECAFVGDSNVDVLTGINSGMRPIAVSWGYCDRETLVSTGPEIIINSPAELLEIFK